MGTWGVGSLENDIAADWMYDLKPAKRTLFGKIKGDPFAYPMGAIETVLNAKEFIEGRECDECVCAAECIATAIGNPLPDSVYSENLSTWRSSLRGEKPSQEMIESAKKSIEIVRNSEHSELRELWSEGQEDGAADTDWLAAIDDLLSRL